MTHAATVRTSSGLWSWGREWILLVGALLLTATTVTGCAAEQLDEEEDEDDTEVTDSEQSELVANGPNGGDLPCADPGVLRDGGAYYVTCTETGETPGIFPIYRSTSLKGNFALVGSVFTAPVPWVDGAKADYWAPEIHKVAQGYAVVFSATNKASGRHAIGLACSRSAQGPYGPCNASGNGYARPIMENGRSLIDAHLLTPQDGNGHTRGDAYLYWKEENPDDIVGAKIDLNSMKVLPGAKRLMRVCKKWEGTVIEAPDVIKRGSFYYMFYSGNWYNNDNYAVGVARARTPLGADARDRDDSKGDGCSAQVFDRKGDGDEPILETYDPPNKGKNYVEGKWIGPGHQKVVKGGDGAFYIFFHAYKRSEACKDDPAKKGQNYTCFKIKGARRYLVIRKLSFAGGWPRKLSFK